MLRYFHRLKSVPLDENDRLRRRNFKPLATARITAAQHVIDPHHIVPRLGKPSAIHFVGAAGRGRLPRAFQPAHLVIIALTAMRANKGSLLGLLFLVEKIFFIHGYQERITARARKLAECPSLAVGFPARINPPGPIHLSRRSPLRSSPSADATAFEPQTLSAPRRSVSVRMHQRLAKARELVGRIPIRPTS